MDRAARGRTAICTAAVALATLGLAACDPGPDATSTSTTADRVTTTTVASTTTSTTSTTTTTTTLPPTTTTTAPPPPPPPPAPAPQPAAAVPAGDDATVTRVTDGDTIVVNGATRVRLIGVDTPEVSFGAQCYGPDASAWMKGALPSGTRVRLEYDLNRTDRYGRTLAYVYRLSDGLNLQVALLQLGLAAAYPFSDTPRYHEWFAAEAIRAKANLVGGWRACIGRDGPLAGPAVK